MKCCKETDKIEKKRQKEQYVVGSMIELYCRKNHKENQKENHDENQIEKQKIRMGKHMLCSECQELLAYSNARSEKCPFMESKTFCANCKVHCYKPEMREKIRVVMRYSGPRMLFYHPCMAVWHLICSMKEKR